MGPATQTGRDGRPLVPTELAAYSLGIKPGAFRSWARRRGVVPAAYGRPAGRRGQASAFWDLADIAAAVAADEVRAG
ncbi:hypothetical protein [Streptomyces sp. NPDC048392]|uniref:hypothetical protein n=1 Tax=Streptomyces sp. NPDC048392 TaxID=3365543 RepID=UPI003714612B